MRTRSPCKAGGSPARKAARQQEYRPFADPAAKFIELSPRALRRAATKRTNWLHGLLAAVSAQHQHLKPARDIRSTKRPETLRIAGAGYQAHLIPVRVANPEPPHTAATRPTPHLAPLPARSLSHPIQPSVLKPPLTAPRTARLAAPGAAPHTGVAWSNPGFVGASSSAHAQWKTPEMMPAYPGIGCLQPTLACREGMAPTIISMFLASGQDIETYVRFLVSQYRANPVMVASLLPSFASEAGNLARIAHLMILEPGCA